MTAESRKKVQLYLYPSQKSQDDIAVNFFEEAPSGLRSSAYRNALISGVALAKIDPRLPEILAVSLSTNPSGKELRDILRGFICGPDDDIKTPPAEAKAPPAKVHTAPAIENPAPVLEPVKKSDALSDDEMDHLRGNTFV